MACNGLFESNQSNRTTKFRCSSFSFAIFRFLIFIIIRLERPLRRLFCLYCSFRCLETNQTINQNSGEEAEKLYGIGKRIASKIDEIIRTGTLRQMELRCVCVCVYVCEMIIKLSFIQICM